jgi:hypothetical protein
MSKTAFGVILCALAAVAPASAEARDQTTCGSAENLFKGGVCTQKPSASWSIDFGKTKLPPLPQPQTPTHGGWRPGHRSHSVRGLSANPSASGFARAFVRGLNMIPPPVEKAPVDCAMFRRADPAIDRGMVRQGHGHVRHSVVIVPAAPCR